MATNVPIKKQIVIEKSAVITFDNVVDEFAFRRYLNENWKDLTLGLKNSTILFLAGVHGSICGKFGPNVDIQTLKNQVRIYKCKPIGLQIFFFDYSSSLKFLRMMSF